MNPIVLIPCRMASTRLPGKPLALIGGIPMVVHVLRRVEKAGIGPVAVACAEEEIADAVRQAGGTAVLTDPGLPSGSDRIYAALQILDPGGRHDIVVNVQGDLPLIPPEQIRAVVRPLQETRFDIATLAAPITDPAEAALEQVVKIACAFGEGQQTASGLYFSRLPIPWGAGSWWHHIGIYAYRRAALERFVSLPASALEQTEKLEQLRALEAGLSIGCSRVDHAPFGVDTPDDLERARKACSNE